VLLETRAQQAAPLRTHEIDPRKIHEPHPSKNRKDGAPLQMHVSNYLDTARTFMVNYYMREYAKSLPSPLPGAHLPPTSNLSWHCNALISQKFSILATSNPLGISEQKHRHSNRLANRQWDS
jgi:hypothetical protein